jgi:hypothetical protein
VRDKRVTLQIREEFSFPTLPTWADVFFNNTDYVSGGISSGYRKLSIGILCGHKSMISLPGSTSGADCRQ